MTMRLFTGISLLGIALVALQAQSGPDLSGVWKANMDQSKFSRAPRGDYRIKVEQQGTDFTVHTRVGQGERMQVTNAKYVIGGDSTSEGFGGPQKSHTEWNGNALVITTTANGRGGETQTTDTYTLSGDKNTLTLSRKVQRGDQSTEDTIVMDRQPDSAWEPEPMTQAVFKNIKVLTDMPMSELRPTMQVFARSLGVECEFCHVQGANDKDDKPTKLTARRMITMVASINKTNFNGAQMVTCWTCHRGNSMPQTAPQ